MFRKAYTALRHIVLATKFLETLPQQLDSRISVSLWDDSVVP